MKNRNKWLWLVGCLGATVIIGFVSVGLFFKIDDRVVLHIDDFSLDKKASTPITVGRNSDIIYDKVPKDYMKVFVDGDNVTWEINDKYKKQDSLMYYKINEANPNLHIIEPSDVISVEMEGGDKEEIRVEEIQRLLAGCESHYILLKNFIAKKHFEAEPDKSINKYIKDKKIKSFLYRKEKKDAFSLVILDKYTTIKKSDKTLGYVMKGSAELENNTAKIQFLYVTNSFYRKGKPDANFNIEGVNYAAKPLVLTTNWGAGHVSIKRLDAKKVKVLFQKPITYLERTEDLVKMASLSSGVLTYRQKDDSFPMGNNLTVPAFSNAVSLDVCSLKIAGDSISCDTEFLPHVWHAVPQFQRIKAGADKNITARIGYIDNKFLFSCIAWPFLIFVVCVIGCLWVYNTKVRSEREGSFGRSAKQLRLYSVIIFTVAFVYSICRIMISVKLAYTFPFFEKVFAVSIVDPCLVMMLILGLSIVFNHNLISAPLEKNTKFRIIIYKWGGSIMLLIGLVVCFVLFGKMNSTYSDSVLQSYLPDEVTCHDNVFSLKRWNILGWSNQNGMKDLFFNIPYTLILFNILTLLLGIILVARIKWLIKIWGEFTNKIKKALQRFKECVDFKKWVDGAEKPLCYVLRFLLCYVITPAIPILLLRFIPGNFMTAFVTVILIVTLCYTVSHIEFWRCGNFVGVTILSILIAVFYVFAACVGGHDAGYITNALGILTFLAIVYTFAKKNPTRFENDWKRNNKSEILLYLTMIISLIVMHWAIGAVGNQSNDVNYDRTIRRGNLMANYKKYTSSGWRYAETDAEFMRIMRHYMFTSNASDPLSNEDHILHMSISNGQSPVILNDVSIQSSFFSAYGVLAYVVYFGLLLVLSVVVSVSVVHSKGVIGVWSLRRLLAMLMWVGTSIYLILSYVGLLPFTGRLNPGYGVDSVGEALESAFLLAFMLSAKRFADEGEN